jgi:hypothetical protein
MGKIYHDPENANGCDNYDFAKISMNAPDQRIFIAKRGGCTFVHKTRNAMHAGAVLFIIVDIDKEDDIHEFILNDDGTGSDIVIPTVMISSEDGDKILKYIFENEDKKISIVEKFDMKNSNDNPMYEIWLTNSDASGIRFVERFEKFHAMFNGEVLMIPRYFHWDCHDCSEEIIKSTCVCNGKYCGMHEVSTFNGLEVIMEDLR